MNVGINGFGRIGRAIFRINELHPVFDVVAINDIDPDVENHAYLLKYDTNYGKFDGDVVSSNGDMQLVVNDKRIQFYGKEKVSDVPWGKHNVDIVIDASGVIENVFLCHKLIEIGAAKKAIITFSPNEGIDKTVIFGVDGESYDPQTHNVVSAGICDSIATAPVLKILDDEYGVDHGFISILHPWLSYQNLVDGSVRSVASPGHFWTDFALGRASSESLIPKHTTLISALQKVIPEISEKLNAISYRVPTGIVASADLTISLKHSTSKKNINELFKSISFEPNSIIGYTEESLVSIDFKEIRESLFVDGRWTHVLENKTVRLILWYDNEWSYGNRVCDLAAYMAKYLYYSSVSNS